ncbi:MAG: coproporphyrinogen III oxidase family protein [Anaerolineaceae bacterium]|nr:coproporphyrinogen III oxidase family protein [Anaerolineaceae bacterium]MBN2677733.1 coproporphyrinogen III oxidase family protein [Anaerolineaceae bacterium]
MNNKLRAAISTTAPATPLSMRIPERLLTLYLRPLMGSLLNLQPVEDLNLPPAQSELAYSLYIHIPFCETLCPYCSFNRFIFHKELAKQYFQDLRAELRLVHELGYRFDTAYIGGGTPTILIDDLVALIDEVKSQFGIREVSCETNPNHLVPGIIDRLAGCVDRLSVGVQSFTPELLRAVHRLEKFGSPELILDRIAYAAPLFPTFNIDMIFNFPGQTPQMLRGDIQAVMRSAANQVTFYPLMVSRSVARSIGVMGKYSPLTELPLYRIIVEELNQAFESQSVWTFTRQQHQLIDEYIASHEEYLGVGSGSFSYLDGRLFVNTFSLKAYHEFLAKQHLPLTGTKQFSPKERMRYRFLMEFFNGKLDRDHFINSFGITPEIGLWLEMLFMKCFGAIHVDEEHDYRLNPGQQYLIVVMMREFFNSVNQLRDQARRSLSPAERLLCQIDK